MGLSDFFPSTGNGEVDGIIAAGVFLCVVRSLWTDIKKERDIAHGIDLADVRRYYRKAFHSRAQKEEYLKMQDGVETGADGCTEAEPGMDADAYEDEESCRT